MRAVPVAVVGAAAVSLGPASGGYPGGADHPVGRLGVTAYPAGTTREVMLAAVAGEALGVASARAAGLDVIVVDAGRTTGRFRGPGRCGLRGRARHGPGTDGGIGGRRGLRHAAAKGRGGHGRRGTVAPERGRGCGCRMSASTRGRPLRRTLT